MGTISREWTIPLKENVWSEGRADRNPGRTRQWKTLRRRREIEGKAEGNRVREVSLESIRKGEVNQGEDERRRKERREKSAISSVAERRSKVNSGSPIILRHKKVRSIPNSLSSPTLSNHDSVL